MKRVSIELLLVCGGVYQTTVDFFVASNQFFGKLGLLSRITKLGEVEKPTL